MLRIIPKHKGHEELYTYACFALAAIAHKQPHYAAYLASKGGLKHLCRASRMTTTTQADIQEKRKLLGEFLEGFKLDGSISEEMVQEVEERECRRMAQLCVGCGKTREQLDMRPLLRCSACTVAPGYCGAACQKAHWPAHKVECKANRKKT
jgi:hypothetical protein